MQNENQPPETSPLETASITMTDTQQTIHPFTRENLVSFKGRMNRLDYAILSFTILVVSWLIQKQAGLNPIIAAFTALTDPESLAENQGLLATLAIGGLIASAYISVKRFQDIGYPGTMALIFITPLIPLGIISALLAFVIFVLKMILLFAPGTPETNKFGAPPLPNHRNKILLLLIILFLAFMLYSSFSSEAMPIVQPMLEEMMEQAGA